MTIVERKPKKRYVPDLRADMAECDANYIRLLKLFPSMHEQDSLQFGVSGTTHDGTQVSVTILDRCPFTTMVAVKVSNDDDKPWIKWPSLEVRVYHDLNTAEVIKFERHRNLSYRYATPNPDMFAPDEKAQINKFFGELLAFCAENGRAVEPVYISSK